jgi:spore maturation protein CgeB
MSIDLFDYYFTYDQNTYLKLIDSKINAAIIPFAFDSNGFVFENLKEDEEIKKICFLGNLDKQRCAFINALASNGFQIDIFGVNLSNFTLHSNINKYGPKYGVDFWLTLQKYAVQLNLLRPHNLNSHNMRSFDIPGAGGVMLAPRTVDHMSYFEDGVEVFLFSNLDECLTRISLLLNMKFDERANIRASARRKALVKHTYSQRVGHMVSVLGGF